MVLQPVKVSRRTAGRIRAAALADEERTRRGKLAALAERLRLHGAALDAVAEQLEGLEARTARLEKAAGLECQEPAVKLPDPRF